MADKKKMDAIRKRMEAKVQADIDKRDREDIVAGIGNRPDQMDKMTRMAYEDASNRLVSRATDAPGAEKEGNATRKRLKRLYGAK